MRPVEEGLTTDDRGGLVLVTGGAGYVGSHVVQKLLARGDRVRVVDRFLYGAHGLADLLGAPGLEVIPGDVRDADTMEEAVTGVDRVIALAALVGDAACDLSPEETLGVNLQATDVLADVCVRAGVRRVVFASTCSVYGANSDALLREGSWLNPVSSYGRTRLASEELLSARAGELDVVVLRLATVFGWSSRMRVDLLVNTFTAHAWFRRKIRVFGGNQWRPNVHVQDAAAAFVLASAAPEALVRGETFNVGSDAENHTVLDIARLVQGRLPETEIDITAEATDRRDYRVSFEKIRQVLGFVTGFGVNDGISEMIEQFQAGKIADPSDPLYDNYKYLRTRGFARVPVRAVAGER